MHYELWEFRTRSLVATYDSEAAALRVVRELIAAGWSPRELSLGLEGTRRSQPTGRRYPLTGDELATRAFQASEVAEQSA